MTPEVAVDLFREALWLTTMMVAVLVVPSLLVGLLVAMFQASTQINEQTLSFLPRLLVMLITLIVARPWLVQTFMEYILQLYGSIPQSIGCPHAIAPGVDRHPDQYLGGFVYLAAVPGHGGADEHAGVRHHPGTAPHPPVFRGGDHRGPDAGLAADAAGQCTGPQCADADCRADPHRLAAGLLPAVVLPGLRDCRADHLDPDGHGLRVHGRPHQRRVGGGDRAVPDHAGDLAVPGHERPPGGVRGADRKFHHLAGRLGAGGQSLLGTGGAPQLGVGRFAVAGAAGDHCAAGGQHRLWRDDPRGAATEYLLYRFPVDPGVGHGDFLDRHGRHSQSVSTAGDRRLAVLT